MIDELRERCAGLAFAPLPELTGPEGVPTGGAWFTAAEMREHVAKLLAAQGESVPPGPRAMEALRVLLRELIFCTAASVYLFEAAPRIDAGSYWFHYDDESWGVRGACCLDFTDGVQSMCLTCPLLDDAARGELWAVSKLRRPLDIRQA